MSEQPVRIREFQSMGTTISIQGVDVVLTRFSNDVSWIEQSARAWERRFSRFDPESELSRINRAAGMASNVSRVFLEVLETAIAGVKRTQGRFNPAVLPRLKEFGYDRSFVQLAEFDRRHKIANDSPVDTAWVDHVEVDHAGRKIRLPKGIELDFGGVAKGIFVDRVSSRLTSWPGGCVNAGGDLVLWGKAPRTAPWTVGVQHPRYSGRDVLNLRIRPTRSISIATSSTSRRRWRHGDGWANHLVDPSTGRPVSMDTPAITILGDSLAEAEIETKSVLIAAAQGIPPFHVSDSTGIMAFEDGTYEAFGNPKFGSRRIHSANEARQSA